MEGGGLGKEGRRLPCGRWGRAAGWALGGQAVGRWGGRPASVLRREKRRRAFRRVDGGREKLTREKWRPEHWAAAGESGTLDIIRVLI